MELDRLLEPFAQSTDEKVGLALLAALKAVAGPVEPARRDAQAAAGEVPRPRSSKQAEELYAALDADAAKQQAQLEELLAALKDGDVRRGQAVFNSTKAACAACHAIGYLGGKVGPDLTRIGQIRTERDLLEAIVFPSASFVRSYEPVRRRHQGRQGPQRPGPQGRPRRGRAGDRRPTRRCASPADEIEEMQPEQGVGHAGGPGPAADAAASWPTWWRSSRRANEKRPSGSPAWLP